MEKVSLIDMQNLGIVCYDIGFDENYLVLNGDNLKITIQGQFSGKQKTFCQFLYEFLKSRLNFKYSRKKDDTHRFCISEITDSENVVT